MKLTNKILLSVFVFGVAAMSAQAQQQKIAVIDLKSVFDNYYKTKIADAQLKEEGAEFSATEQTLYKDYEAMNSEYNALVEQANNQILSAEERAARRTQADAKLREIKALEENLENFRRTAQTTLVEKQRRMRDNILKEANELIAARAKSEGYSLVIDLAAVSKNDTPVVLYSDGSHDMTEEILDSLNADAPDDMDLEAAAETAE